MKTHIKTEIGRYKGHKYLLEYGRMCDIGCYELCCKRWFLTVEGYYQGDFGTKKEVFEFMDQGKFI